MSLIQKAFGDIITFTRASAATRINAAGVLETVGNNVPRIDYDPVTLACRGLLIEEQRTNVIRNSLMQGAVVGVVGAGGALPSNWSVLAPGRSHEVVAIGTSNGMSFIDLRVFGSSATPYAVLIFDSTSATVGQTWTGSARIACIAGSLLPLSVLNLRVQEVNASNATLQTDLNIKPNVPSNISAGHIFGVSRQLSMSDANNVRLRLEMGVPANENIDLTLRIATPQLEAGAFATSYIPTAGSQVTRAADVASINTLSPWYNASEGTLFAEFTSQGTTSSKFFTVEFANTPRSRTIGVLNGSVRQAAMQSGTFVSEVNQTFGTVVDFEVARRAIAYRQNDSVAASNGTVGAVDTACIVDTFDRLLLGNNQAGTQLAAGHIRKLRYFPKRLPNAQLQSLTA